LRLKNNNDTLTVNQIIQAVFIIKDIQRDPYSTDGLGKPEMLKENFTGYYSRRVTAEHRIVYKIVNDLIIIAQCRYHY
jgi:toxin YoeB